MTDDNGNLSIDFLVGFTIFILAFIWVVSMIPRVVNRVAVLYYRL